MQAPSEILRHLPVSEIMSRWPQSVSVFLSYKLDCVGCPMARFETLEETLEVYHLPKEAFLNDLLAIIPSSELEF